MLKNLLILFVLLFGMLATNAQQSHVNLDWAPQRNSEGLTPFMANPISPEVYDDHRVTFRVKAPDAREVLLSGSILLGLKTEKPIPFTKADDGLWNLTVGPMTPEIYYYKLLIDGMSVVDPANTLVGFAAQPGFSVLVVYGDGPAWYDAKDIPHGVVSRHIYHSEVMDGERELYVYTPPGNFRIVDGRTTCTNYRDE